jgi:mycothiol synthase
MCVARPTFRLHLLSGKGWSLLDRSDMLMTNALQSRAYAGEIDLEAIVAFLNLVEDHDRVEEGSSVSELREELTEPSFDSVNGLRLYENEHGALVGFAQLYIAADSAEQEGFLWFKVHPAYRTNQIEPRMFAWAEEQLGQHRRVQLRVMAHDNETERQTLLVRHGFTPIRYYLRMSRPLSELIPEPVFPPGYHVRAGNHEPHAWADLYNDSFADHYNFQPRDAAFVEHWQRDPDYSSDLNLVVTAPDGTLAAFAWCHIHSERNRRSGRRDGTIGVLGTRPAHRRRGLGRALLLTGMQLLRRAGMSAAELGVDAASPTGAHTLYESVGFRVAHGYAVYSRDVKS